MMLKDLQFPFHAEEILKNRKKLRRQLLSDGSARRELRVAILGGYTTRDVREILELFLLDMGYAPSFYETEFGLYYEAGVFPNPELKAFSPQVIYIHTGSRNIISFPGAGDDKERVAALEKAEFDRFRTLWEALEGRYGCPVIQNNFEAPYARVLGNLDGSDVHGRLRFTRALNARFAEYAEAHPFLHLQDIEYLSAAYGLAKWADPSYYHLYKYLCAPEAVPELALNLASMIRALAGGSKKLLALDLDNTLWGGIVGEDGPENIEIGQETALGQVYAEFQSYLKSLKERGVLLAVNSKNDEENAIAGLSRPDSVLHPEDFAAIFANWQSKDRNLTEMASQLSLGIDSFVFADDNPAEREIIRAQVPDVSVPEMTDPALYIAAIDRGGYFEPASLSADDYKRAEMYRENRERAQQAASFDNYEDYLRSLEMTAEIGSFPPHYMSRIAQLTNKSNQFNLTTLRLTQPELETLCADPQVLTQYGRLTDRFGDNGVVSVAMGHREGDVMHIDLWLMSCRVLQRQMECAMMDEFVRRARAMGCTSLRGYYYPTAKNHMVENFYLERGFADDGEAVRAADGAVGRAYVLDITAERAPECSVIRVVKAE